MPEEKDETVEDQCEECGNSCDVLPCAFCDNPMCADHRGTYKTDAPDMPSIMEICKDCVP